MNDLENRLRASFHQQVNVPVPLAGLAGSVVVAARRRRRIEAAGALAAVVAVAGVVAVAASSGTPTTTRPVVPASQPPTAVNEVATRGWVEGLAHDALPHLATPVTVGTRAVFPEATASVIGVAQQVVAGTPLASGVLLTTSPVEGSSGDVTRLTVLSPHGNLHELAQDVVYGHAVDASGTRVAFGYLQGGKDVVVNIATGAVLAERTLPGPFGAGTPFAFYGDEVLMTVGDGAAVSAQAWNTVTGKVRTIGSAADSYWGGYGIAPGSDVVALRQGDGTCVAVSHLAQVGDLWTVCDGVYGGFSPDGRSLLMVADPAGPDRVFQPTRVRDALTGTVTGTPALPEHGVLAVGWSDDRTLAAVVRVEDGSPGGPVVLVVTCPLSGAPCTAHEQLPDTKLGWVVGARG